ncbi:conserved hypothetical protein [Methanocaldococcus vulcanius M7]|uniref:DUF155 domain-containing protein n=1 Tax=Methanocaldococcus vulcanius (strain ATCC 700851 / DSM 12094 / M7) TaxID=579137 RepID=C9RDN1_METVM|nr:hypothetical protein [Methanocaldococcus vulcanius]ACX73410.1 conserved hypothetical protein [Methanocaldococcus vulcanius M7]
MSGALSGKIVQIVVGYLKESIYSEQMMRPRVKRICSYEEFLPTYSLIERITEENKEVDIKVYERNIIVEIVRDFKDKSVVELFEIKESLFEDALKYLKEYEADRFLESYTLYCFSDYSDPELFIRENKDVLAKLLRDQYEDVPEEYFDEVLEGKIKYSTKDLIILDWDNGIILDKNEDFWEEVDIIELACIRVLNLRVFDVMLSEAIQYLTKLHWEKLGYFKLKKLSKDLYLQRISYISYFDSIENVLMLYGDRYYAELYERLCEIFYVSEWIKRVEKKMEMISEIYMMVRQFLTEFYGFILEGSIVALILLEVILALSR